jgi:hypothetical protein
MAKTTDAGLSRRKMMLIAGGTVAGAGALVAAPFRTAIRNVFRKAEATGGGVSRGPLLLATAGYDDWMGVVGSSFSLGGGSYIQLAGVRPLPTSGARPQGVRAQGFAAFFDPASGQSLAPDLIYTATHSQYGPMQIYLAGTSDPRTPGRMVAVFN